MGTRGSGFNREILRAEAEKRAAEKPIKLEGSLLDETMLKNNQGLLRITEEQIAAAGSEEKKYKFQIHAYDDEDPTTGAVKNIVYTTLIDTTPDKALARAIYLLPYKIFHRVAGIEEIE
jgi:hypothetical protein